MKPGYDTAWRPEHRRISRRELLELSGLGFGNLALTYLLNQSSLLASSGSTSDTLYHDLKPRRPHFEGPAKAVIQLMQNGGPSQMDLFDPNLNSTGEVVRTTQGTSRSSSRATQMCSWLTI